jgi:DNA invertase Pin-like site-specific DNA recombinase
MKANKNTSKSTKANVVAYIRVSTSQQSEEGVSLDAQRLAIEQYASLYGLNVIDWCCDAGVSASSLKRPELQRALGFLDAGKASGLIVLKLDRLTRCVSDLGYLLDNYFQKHSLLAVVEQLDTRSASGRLVLNVLTSVGQWEREATAERTRLALQYKRARGEYTGGQAPIGFVQADNGMIRVNEYEKKAIKRAQELKKAGYSYTKLIEKLFSEGFKSRAGKAFDIKTMQKMIKINLDN